jgi:hypothetical protein
MFREKGDLLSRKRDVLPFAEVLDVLLVKHDSLPLYFGLLKVDE